jgi:hypothetical protein
MTIDGELLVQDIAHDILTHAHENISTGTVRRAVNQVFLSFDRTHFGSRTEQVYTKLQTLLYRDLNGLQVLGLQESRQRFLIFSCLARHTESNRLAEALVGFLSEQILIVAEQEEPYHVHEWRLALYELRGLVHSQVLVQLASYFRGQSGTSVRDDWLTRASFSAHEAKMMRAIADAQRLPALEQYRGRRHGRLDRLPQWCAVRARSAPAYHAGGHDLDLRLGFEIPRSNWVSPIMSPVRTPSSGLLNNYDLHQLEQDIQVAEVDRLRLRVERLELEQGGG